MPPIASLVVRISGQISELQQSFADSTKAVGDFRTSFEKSAASIQATVDGISKTFSSFGSVVGTIGVAVAGVTAAAAAFTVAFKAVQGAVDTIGGVIQNAVSKTADLGDSLFALSQKTSLSVESLSGFKFVAAQTNTSLESITGAVFKLEANLGKGSKDTVAALSTIGLSLKQLRGEDPSQAFTEIIAKLGELPNASARAAAGVAIFGKSFKDIAQLSQENLPELIKQAKDLGVVMSQETAVAADRFHDALGAISAASDGLQQQLGAKLLPAAVAFAEVFGGIFIDAIKQVTGSTKNLGEGFDQFVVFLGQVAARFIEILARMVEATAQWAADISKRIADETRDFLDLAPSIITVGKALDLALSGGSHQSAFEALSKNLESLRKPLDALASGAVAAGNTIRDFAKGIETAAKGAGENFGTTFARIQGEIAASADKIRQSLKSVGDGGVEGAEKSSDAFKSFEKQLGDLTAQIDRAKANGTPLAELVRLFGDEAAKATPKAHAWGIAVADSVEEVSRAFTKLATEKIFDKLDDGLQKFARHLEQTQFKKLQADFHEATVAALEFEKTIKKLDDGFSTFANKRFENTFKKVASEMKSTEQVAAELGNTFGKVFSRIGTSLVDDFAKGFQQGGLTGAMVSVASGASQKFGEVFKAGTARVLKDTAAGLDAELTFGETAAGWGAVAAQSFITGFQSGLQNPGTTSALTSVAGGFLTGLLFFGPVGAGVGAALGLAGFLAGAFKNAKEEAAALRVEMSKIDLQFHGRANLVAIAERAGFSLPTRTQAAGGPPATAAESVDALFKSGNVEDFNKRIGLLNQALDAYNERLKALASATDAVNSRTAAFAKQFTPLIEAKKSATDSGDTKAAAAVSQKIQEVAQRTQPEFERLGLFVKDTFAGIVKETGNAAAAITQLAPSFQLLKDGISDFGLTSTGVIDSLLSDFNLLTDAAFKPFFDNIQTSGQLVKNLFDAKALSPEGFQAAAADIGQSIQEIVNRGGDIAKTLALSQPVLQSLWEEQQTFGGVTDQTTQSILKQAEQQGLVGEAFKSTQEKVLDVLLAIAKVFHADIPAGIEATQTAATTAAAGISSAFSGTVDGIDSRIRTGIGGAFKDIVIPAGAAGDEIRKALEIQADHAAKGIQASLAGAVDQSASNLEFKIGRSFSSLPGKAKAAADGIETALSGIDVPDIKIAVDLDSSAIDRLNLGDSRLQTGFDVPALGSGGIVRKRTLAIVGEAGPEAVVPLHRLQSGSQPLRGESRVVFGPGSVVINGPVDSNERAEQVVRDFARVVRRGGAYRTVAMRSLGLEKV